MTDPMSLKSLSLRVLLLNAVAVSLAVVIYQLGGRDHFGERGFITFLSTLQLLYTAWLAHKILQAQRFLLSADKQPQLVLWRMITFGFIFLAADEFLSLHEVADLFIHDLLNMPVTNVSDRLDDLIVLLYGLLSIGLLWKYRQTFRPYKTAIALFRKGFMLLFLMIAFDLLANEQDLLEIAFTPETSNTLQIYLNQVEDTIKVFAEAVFILAFYSILQATQCRSRDWQLLRQHSKVK